MVVSIRGAGHLPGWAVVVLAVVVTAAVTVWFTGRSDDWRDHDLQAEADGRLISPVVMSLQGGIAGSDALVVVRPSGDYVVQFGGLSHASPIGGQLMPEEIRDIADAVAEARLQVQQVEGPSGACCDIQYRLVTYGPRSYESSSGAGGRVVPLEPLLDGLVERARLALDETQE